MCATSLALISLWHCRHAASDSIFGFNWPLRAHVVTSAWPGESKCISWQEMQENSPPRKQGDACTPLNSRPVTRIIPSPQNLLPKKPRLGPANKIFLVTVIGHVWLHDKTLREIVSARTEAGAVAIEIYFVRHVIKGPDAVALTASER